jgi:hypothetical protein
VQPQLGDTEISITDTAWQMEAENLARARDMVQTMLQDWDLCRGMRCLLMTWCFHSSWGRSASIGSTISAESAELQVFGREDAKRVLKSIYRDLKNRTCVTTEVVSGYDVALPGNLVVPTTKENEDDRSLPIALYMAFNPDGKIQKLTIAAVDLHPLTEAIRSAAENGGLQPS